MKTHRTWFKVIFNPILRKFGRSIVSIFSGNTLKGYQLRKYPENCEVIKCNHNVKSWNNGTYNCSYCGKDFTYYR
jgi:hypothetical protein